MLVKQISTSIFLEKNLYVLVLTLFKRTLTCYQIRRPLSSKRILNDIDASIQSKIDVRWAPSTCRSLRLKGSPDYVLRGDIA